MFIRFPVFHRHITPHENEQINWIILDNTTCGESHAYEQLAP